MKMRFKIISALLLSVSLVACKPSTESVEVPLAAQFSDDATGHFCHMFLSEHDGPKAHLFLAGQEEPVWFTEVNQLFAFRLLPEEPKNVVAMYVNDASGVQDWTDHSVNKNWLDAKTAFYVIESSFIGGMGSSDALPFKDRAAAEAYTADNGGRVVSFDEMPESFVFQQPLQSHAEQGAHDPAASESAHQNH
ncbi:MAG: nitrous oxide reductase accessory protein NosL [Alcaligenaceae bacterium]|nr:nitrous oxide reductase accessory protein NosL [Alcaligenaceae bacterium]